MFPNTHIAFIAALLFFLICLIACARSVISDNYRKKYAKWGKRGNSIPVTKLSCFVMAIFFLSLSITLVLYIFYFIVDIKLLYNLIYLSFPIFFSLYIYDYLVWKKTIT